MTTYYSRHTKILTGCQLSSHEMTPLSFPNYYARLTWGGRLEFGLPGSPLAVWLMMNALKVRNSRRHFEYDVIGK